ncbi:MAG: hypothetical protein LBB85_04655 [Dysgonamonadaceae bacterium]|jgi:hypothetical protein|nr:hypothetical protein [Dysgonamonadaceae bacterium]
MKTKQNVKHFLMHVVICPAIIAIFSVVFMLLWNWLIPDIFGGKVINFWQALGLLALSRILFGRFGKHWMRKGQMRHHGNPIYEKWMNMSPEQQEEFFLKRKEQMKEHWRTRYHDCFDRKRDFYDHRDFDPKHDPSFDKDNE